MLLVFFIIVITLIIILTTDLKLLIAIRDNNLTVNLKIYILKFILLAKIDLTKNKFSKSKFKKNKKIQEKIKQYSKNKISSLKRINKAIRDIKLNLEHLDLKIDISTTDCILTSYAVAIISNIITFIIKGLNFKINFKNCKYKVNPLYVNKKVLDIKLECIIKANIVHIIRMIYKNKLIWCNFSVPFFLI